MYEWMEERILYLECHRPQNQINVCHLTGHVTVSVRAECDQSLLGPQLTDMMTLTLDRNH